MKSLIFVLALFAVTIGAVIWIDFALDAKISNIVVLCEEIENTDDASKAKEAFDDVNEKWHSVRKWLFAVLNHSDIDIVDYAVEILRFAVEAGDIDKIHLNACSLKYYLDDILDTETLSLSNIL